MNNEAPDDRPKRKRASRWHHPMWWANLLAVPPLLLAYLSTLVSPATFWPLAFFGMAYPYLLAVHLIFLVYWLFFRRKRMWVSLLAIVPGWGHVGQYVQVFGTAAAEKAPGAFKVMSYNVRLFDLYNWSGNAQTRDGIFDLLVAENADVLCLQEFFNGDDDYDFPTKDTLMRNFRWTSIHDEYTQHTRLGRHFGIATISTFPIVAKGSIHFPDDLNNLCIWTDLRIGTDTVRVYNAHLASIRFGDQDYRFMEGLEPGMQGDSIASGGRRILGRLKNAFVRRAAEVQRITAHMRTCRHPILWCGDLNDTPMSYSYARLNDLLVDAFEECGQGIGHTYIGAFPSFRIDHIMHSAGWHSTGFRTLPDELSDHRAIVCWMQPE